MMNDILQSPLVVVRKSDLDAMINERVESKVSTKVSDSVTDTSADGEAITTYLCNGVRYISRKDTAKLIGVDVSTLWLWNKKGILRSIKRGGRKVHYRYDDVISIINGGSSTTE